MGFLDKVKAQATQAAEKAQQGMASGQAKLSELQARKQADALLRDLGAAYYAEQRSAGPATAVAEALARVDAHAAQHGPVDTAATAPAPTTPPVPPAGSPAPTTSAQGTPPPSAPSPPPSGNFNLDDL